MSSISYNRWFFANVADIIMELSWRVEEFTTFVALITSSLLVLAMRTCSCDKSISQKQVTNLAIALCHLFFWYSFVFVDIKEDFLSNFSMPLCTCPSEVVKANIKPFVDLFMYFIVKIADFFRSFLLLHSLYFSRSTILVSSTNVKSVDTLQFFESRKNVCWKYTTNDVTQMRYIVDIWQSWSNQNVFSSCFW